MSREQFCSRTSLDGDALARPASSNRKTLSISTKISILNGSFACDESHTSPDLSHLLICITHYLERGCCTGAHSLPCVPHTYAEAVSSLR